MSSDLCSLALFCIKMMLGFSYNCALVQLIFLPYPSAAAKSLPLCLTLCDPIDSSPPGSAVPGILQARTLEWVAISFSNAWKWKVKVKSLCRARLLATAWTAAFQAPPSMGFSRQEYWSGVPSPSLIIYIIQYNSHYIHNSLIIILKNLKGFDGNINQYSHCGKQYKVPQKKKTKNRVTVWSSNPTPGYISGENLIWKDTCTPVFTAGLFPTAKTRKCPSTEERIKKMWYICIFVVVAQLLSHVWLFVTPMDCSPPSSVHLQARILEWVAIPFSRGSSWCKDRTGVSSIADRFFTI